MFGTLNCVVEDGANDDNHTATAIEDLTKATWRYS